MWEAPFELWEELVLRSLIAETIGLRSETTPSRELSLAIERLAEQVALVAKSEEQQTNPGTPRLEASTQARLVRLRSGVSALVSDPAIRSELLAQLHLAQRLAATRSCTKCSKSTGYQCAGKDRLLDAQQGQKAGLCLTPFRDAFRFCELVASKLYARLQNNHAPIRIDFALQPAQAHPHGLEVPVAVTGACDFDDGVAGKGRLHRKSTVTLHINVAGMDWPSLASIPYVLMHEVVCHAYQGCCSAGARAMNTEGGRGSEAAQFADGWLDHVAIDVVKSALRDHAFGKLDGIPRSPEVALRWLEHGVQLHQARYSQRADEGQLKFGKQCAWLLEMFLQRYAEMHAPWHDTNWAALKAREFALALNAVRDAESEERVVMALREIGPVLHHAILPEGHEAAGLLWKAVQSFCLDLDVDALLVSLQSIQVDLYPMERTSSS